MDAYSLALKFQTQGFDDVFRKLDETDRKGQRVAQTGDRASASLQRVANRAGNMAGAIAQAGEVGTSALTKLVNITSSVAFGFGPQGAIVAAAGVAALAVVSIFTRARKEMEETDKKARELLRGLSLESGAATATRLYSGDQFAKAGSPEALGIEGSRARLAEVSRTLAQGGLGRGERSELIKENAALLDFLKQAGPLYERVTARVKELTAAEVERNTNAIRFAAEEEARTKAKTAAKEAEQLQWTRLKGTISDTAGALERIAENTQGDVSGFINKQLGETASQTTGLIGTQVAKTPEGTGGRSSMVEAFEANAREIAEQAAGRMRDMIANTFGDALTEGFTAAFSGKGILGGFKQLGKSVLAGLGGIFIDMGKKLLVYGATMMGLLPALSNPFTSGPAALAAGAALVALGAGMSAIAGRGSGGDSGGGGGGSSYSSTAPRADDYTRIRLYSGWGESAGGITERRETNNHFTIIGPRDPVAQREILDLVTRAERR